MIDLANHHIIPISRGYRGPKRRGGGDLIFPSTLRSWGLRGRQAPDGEWVYLSLLSVGGTLCTSVEAIQQFCERLTPKPMAPNRPASPARRRREDERAAKQCERFGL